MKKIIFKNWLGNENVAFTYDKLTIDKGGVGIIHVGKNILLFQMGDVEEFEIKCEN